MWLVLDEQRFEDAAVNDLGTLSLWHHEEKEESKADEVVEWNIREEEADVHLNGLKHSEDAPVAEPHIGLLLVLSLNRLYRLDHWVYACQNNTNNIVALHDNADDGDRGRKAEKYHTWWNSLLFAGLNELWEVGRVFIELCRNLVNVLHNCKYFLLLINQ